MTHYILITILFLIFSNMSNKITYTDKIGLTDKTNHANQWWDDDANEIKIKHNLNDTRIDNLEENQVTGVQVYTTYADLPVTGTLLVSYKVADDPTPSNNGYYHWNGSVYLPDASLANGLINLGESEAVNGDTVYSELDSTGNIFCRSGVDLQTYINNHRIVNLLPITYTITSPLVIPSNTKIRGVDGLTVIKAGNPTMTSLILIDDESHISIECVKLEGFAKNTTTLTGLADVKAKTGIGVQSGIYVTDECYYVSFSKVYCLFMSRAGIEVGGLTAFAYLEGLHVDKCWFNSCYIGLFLDAQGEYGQYTDMTINECQIGLWSDAGNIILSGINSNYNQVGAVFSGLAGANDTHNTVAASMFNHNTLYSIVCTEMLNGVTFNGCHIFEGNAYVDDSMGFNWIGGILAAAITFDRGGAGHVGVSMIANTMFFSGSYGSGTITLTGSPSPTVLLKNNYYIGGEDSSGINN